VYKKKKDIDLENQKLQIPSRGSLLSLMEMLWNRNKYVTD